MDTPTIISVSNLTKYYGSTLGVQTINFTVNQGEIFGFLGPNGAGKTSTIRMLLDLLRKYEISKLRNKEGLQGLLPKSF